ncbi:cobalt-precorrin 5A hydrolase [Desulfothermobacter acidiphilus]|uniref:cobalt-precorrin 5A hydrolase n=1 Tax=Desulfothermobacter acidiphilus TaxID=1938353 RepID=UPI003F8B1E5E
MKELAVVVLGQRGRELVRKLERKWPGPLKIYLPQRLREEGKETYHSLPQLIAALFPRVEGLIWVGAVGIAVRLLASHLRDKYFDPPVVVLDEAGRFAVSLLGGHHGANELATELAAVLGAVPVITTASDALGLISWDSFARQYGLALYPRDHLPRATRSLLEGEEILLYWDEQLPLLPLPWPERVRRFLWNSDQILSESGAITVLVTARRCPQPPPFLLLCPRKLVVGIGCRRGVEAGQIREALEVTLEEAGWALPAIKCIASVEAKRDEQGLVAVALALGLPLRFFSVEELALVERTWPAPLPVSEQVLKRMGVGNVCANAALAAGGKQLLVSKRIFPGVTVALAECDWP